jgi:hypothetical protein
MNSLQIFRSFMLRTADGSLDASRIHSLECYTEWREHRGNPPDCETELKTFQKTLSNHLCGVDKRAPFNREEEAAILIVLKERKRWPCCPAEYQIGTRGFRSLGYYEKQAEAAAEGEGAANKRRRQSTGAACSEPPDAAATVPSTPVLARADAFAKLLLIGWDFQRYLYLCLEFSADDGRQIAFYILSEVFQRNFPSLVEVALLDRIAAAQALCRNASVDEDVGVMIVSPRDTRFLAQNSTSLAQLGRIVGTSYTGQIVQAIDFPKVVYTVICALYEPGREFAVSNVLLPSLNGLMRVPYQVGFRMDPVHQLMLVSVRSRAA